MPDNEEEMTPGPEKKTGDRAPLMSSQEAAGRKTGKLPNIGDKLAAAGKATAFAPFKLGEMIGKNAFAATMQTYNPTNPFNMAAASLGPLAGVWSELYKKSAGGQGGGGLESLFDLTPVVEELHAIRATVMAMAELQKKSTGYLQTTSKASGIIAQDNRAAKEATTKAHEDAENMRKAIENMHETVKRLTFQPDPDKSFDMTRNTDTAVYHLDGPVPQIFTDGFEEENSDQPKIAGPLNMIAADVHFLAALAKEKDREEDIKQALLPDLTEDKADGMESDDPNNAGVNPDKKKGFGAFIGNLFKLLGKGGPVMWALMLIVAGIALIKPLRDAVIGLGKSILDGTLAKQIGEAVMDAIRGIGDWAKEKTGELMSNLGFGENAKTMKNDYGMTATAITATSPGQDVAAGVDAGVKAEKAAPAWIKEGMQASLAATNPMMAAHVAKSAEITPAPPAATKVSTLDQKSVNATSTKQATNVNINNQPTNVQNNTMGQQQSPVIMPGVSLIEKTKAMRSGR